LIKFVCDDCGEEAIYKFNWEFIYVENETNIPAPFNERKGHVCETCKDRLIMFLITRKPWIDDE